MSNEGNRIQLEASDNQSVWINVQQDGGNFSNMYVEVVGQVNPDLSVQEMQSVNFGNDFGNFHIYPKEICA